jgi:TolB-like protein
VQADLPVASGTAEPVLAVLPLVNLTQRSAAVRVAKTEIHRQLTLRGIEFLSDDELRPTLRKHRIRSRSGLTESDIGAIREATNVSHLLLGSVDFFEDARNVEMGLSLRLLNAASLGISRAASFSATGEDFEGLFGVGRIDSVDALAAEVVGRLFEELEEPVRARKKPEGVGQLETRIVIVPFDDLSNRRYAGAVISNLLLSQLVREGFAVAEPGLIKAIFLESNLVPRGEIDHTIRGRIVEAYYPDFIVTGTVATFETRRGSSTAAVPKLELNARILDAVSGRILWSMDDERAGTDSQKFLGIGRRLSLGQVTNDSLHDVLEQIEREEKKIIAQAN